MEDRRRAERAAMALELAEPAGDLNDDPEYVEVAPEKPPPLPAPEPPLELEEFERDMWRKLHAEHALNDAKRALTAANPRADPEAARGDPPRRHRDLE